MTDSILAFGAALFCVLLAITAAIRKRSSIASWSFAAGMVALGAETACAAVSLESHTLARALQWQWFALIAKALLPGFWLCFSLTYARGNYAEFLRKWRGLLALTFILPVAIAFVFRSDLLTLVRNDSGEAWIALSEIGRILSGISLIAIVLVLANLEKTFRSAVGTMRWRIKFLVLGVGVIFGARIYTGSQALLFSTTSLALTQFQSGAILIGCSLIIIGYLRSGFAEADIYPSHAVLEGSVSMLVAGGYLFVVGVLAQIVVAIGGERYFRSQALLVLLGVVGLAALLLSDRVRQWRRRFVSQHFRRPQHDFRKVWTLFTERGSAVLNEAGLCDVAAKLICETFDVLSVTIWLVEEGRHRIAISSSTSQARRDPDDSRSVWEEEEMKLASLRQRTTPFDLETPKEAWAEKLRELNPSQFRTGGNRICVPLLSGTRWLGVAVVADRVSGLSYTDEELDLLKCVGDQVATSLLNLRLAEENMRAKELEAFQTLSAFFVHDLKNAASGLNLTLKNLPIHFDDPEFRADALRGIANTVERFTTLINRLSQIRGKLEVRPVDLDLNQLVRESLESFQGALGVELETNLAPIPHVAGDHDHLRSVIDNLLFNARDAVLDGGRIEIATSHGKEGAILTVADTGCGMSDDFLRHSLFRPFRTTKKKGIGIGMFQARAIVEAHKGTILVESELRKGSTFKVVLPLTPAQP